MRFTAGGNHSSECRDFSKGFGNSCRVTIVEIIKDAGTDDFADDKVTVLHDDNL